MLSVGNLYFSFLFQASSESGPIINQPINSKTPEKVPANTGKSILDKSPSKETNKVPNLVFKIRRLDQKLLEIFILDTFNLF